MLVFGCLLSSSFSPQIAPSQARQATIARPRSSALVAPAAEIHLEDLTLVATLPQIEAPDALLRLTVSACRAVVGAGMGGYTVQAAQCGLELAHSMRSIFTLHSVGTVRALEGLLRKPTAGDGNGPEKERLSWLRNSAMLALNPLEFWRWWSRMLPRTVPVAPVAVRRVAASLWLVWILCTASLSIGKLRGPTSDIERRTLRRRLLKLALDVPVASNFMLAAPLLPIFVIGFLGVLSSYQMLKMAVEAPSKPRTLRLPIVASLVSSSSFAPSPRFRERLESFGRRNNRIPLCSSRDGLPKIGMLPQYRSQDFLPQIPLCSSKDSLSRIPSSSSRDGLPRIPLCSRREGPQAACIPSCSSRDRLPAAAAL